MYHKLECPWCGNEIMVRGTTEKKTTQKCHWCRRCVGVSCKKVKGKIVFDAEPEDFPEPEREPVKPYQDRYSISMSGLEYGR